jgi:predicted regulator of Ras-like GTPase activity (Roadblock/LC7/MglB family)
MNFWDTVQGHHLAEVLIESLPKIAKNKKQYILCDTKDKIAHRVCVAMDCGDRYIGTISTDSLNQISVVMEKAI